MKALVIGASGFTGSYLANRLVEKGYDVYGFVRPTSNVDALSPKVTLIRGDLTFRDSVFQAIEGMDCVYHIAATYRDSGVCEQTYYDVNVMGTRHVLDACLDATVGRMVHCSTVGVHGHVENPPATERSPFNPSDVYQSTKLEAERLVGQYIESGLAATVCRPVGIYGPGNTRFLKLFRAIQKRTFIMFGTGDVLYHLTYVEDVVRGLIACGEIPRALGETYIIAGKTATTLNELVARVASVLGVKEPIFRLPFWALWQAAVLCEGLCKPLGLRPPLFRRRTDFFCQDRAFDTSKIRRGLGFQPGVELETGLRQTAVWYKAQNLL